MGNIKLPCTPGPIYRYTSHGHCFHILRAIAVSATVKFQQYDHDEVIQIIRSTGSGVLCRIRLLYDEIPLYNFLPRMYNFEEKKANDNGNRAKNSLLHAIGKWEKNCIVV